MRNRKVLHIMWYLFSALLVMWLAGIPAAILTGLFRIESNVAGTAMTAGITILIVYRMYGTDRDSSARDGNMWWKQRGSAGVKEYLCLAVFGIAMCIVLNLLMGMAGVAGKDTAYLEVAKQMNKEPYLLQFIGLGILAPAAEELVYRGMIYRRMREGIGYWKAALFVSVLFGAGHGYLSQCLYALIMGMFLAYVYEKFRTLKAAVFLHVVMNVVVLLQNWTNGFAWMMESFARAAVIMVLLTVAAIITFEKIRKIQPELR